MLIRRQNTYAPSAGGAQVVMKPKSVKPLNKGKNLPVEEAEEIKMKNKCEELKT
jgi:hypothetical protein